MLDMKFVRNNQDVVKTKLLSRGLKLEVINSFFEAEKNYRSTLQEVEELKAKRNQLVPQGKPTQEQRIQLKELSTTIKQKQDSLDVLKSNYEEIALCIPNLPLDDCPVGLSEDDNKVIRKIGEIPNFDFEVKSHDQLGIDLNLFDFDQAAAITGSRFVVYHNEGALLERALINFMLDTHIYEHGYKEVMPPVVVNSKTLTGTGQLPKFSEDLFKLEDTDYWLSPTAEVQLTNLYQNKVIQEKELPLNFVAYTPCFRKEAGSYGKDTKGLIRHHQFNKVELVKLVNPEDSHNQLLDLLSHAEKILQLLKLPYRVVELCSGDLGFSSAKTYDIEVWFPSQNCYREISSCSLFLDFQSRRAMIRYKQASTGSVSFLHTINGSGLAVGRTMAALLENYQQSDGSVIIPECLVRYTKYKKWQITKNI